MHASAHRADGETRPSETQSNNPSQLSLLRKACSAEFLPEAAGRARVSGRDVAFAGWQ